MLTKTHSETLKKAKNNYKQNLKSLLAEVSGIRVDIDGLKLSYENRLKKIIQLNQSETRVKTKMLLDMPETPKCGNCDKLKEKC